MIPQIRDIILRKRIKLTLQQASGYYDYFLLGLRLRDANSTFVLFPGDGFNLHPTAAVAWLHNKYVKFLARPASRNVDRDIAALVLVLDQDSPFVILILRFKAGSEFLVLGITDI
ncbi:hypothetical protein N7520_006885 [Penicillium odoratum]|uniref:uncharacterized protein n=1 Tax=Penicillium odoratum TaxID=1167516 RepID=UPI0025489393|nr:uncharacterized protein N7520_006885 [Penicillium odoratum]KAJ5759729.1 hypothetical protein N7520_006885 [Penicillium odoratum]